MGILTEKAKGEAVSYAIVVVRPGTHLLPMTVGVAGSARTLAHTMVRRCIRMCSSWCSLLRKKVLAALPA